MSFNFVVMANSLISPPDLYTLLCSSPSSVLVFDVRSKDEFSKEKIWSSIHLDIEAFPSMNALQSEVNRMGEKTKAIIPANFKNLFMNWDMYDIIIVDEDGSDKKSLCRQLRHQVHDDKHTRVLVGGYKTFNTLYPGLCVGSPSQDEYLINKCEKEWKKNAPLEVLPYLLFGDKEAAQSFKSIDAMGIEYMVNVSPNLPDYASSAYRYKRCDLPELPFGDLEPLFNECFDFIERARKKGSKVLVYSDTYGDGRAGMVICAYLIRAQECSLERAFVTVKRAFPAFAPNVALLARLTEYEATLFGATYVPSTTAPSNDNIDASGDENNNNTSNNNNDNTAQKEVDKVDERLVTDELRYVRRRQQQQYEEEEYCGSDGELEDLVEEDLC